MGFRRRIEKSIIEVLKGVSNLDGMTITSRPEPDNSSMDELKKKSIANSKGHIYVSCISRKFERQGMSRVLKTKPGISIIIFTKNINTEAGYDRIDDIMDAIVLALYEFGYYIQTDYLVPSVEPQSVLTALLYFERNDASIFPSKEYYGS